MAAKKGSKIPADDVISFVIKNVMKKHGEIGSQKELSRLVMESLKDVDPDYTISPERVRAISLKTHGVSVSVKTRMGDETKKCPSCGHSLKRSYTKNLKGRNIMIKITCPKCGYKGLSGRWAPGKYGFRSE
jgi:predicted RNA-binding Zn-ribbon protein involved in translation (DUF1610 family)